MKNDFDDIKMNSENFILKKKSEIQKTLGNRFFMMRLSAARTG
jgi:hypothetical protein